MSVQNEEEQLLPPEADKPVLHEQIETLSKSLAEYQEKAQDSWDRLLRKEAELQNVQKRAQQDIENAKKFAIERFAQDLLQVLDSLEHGVNYAQTGQTAVKDLHDGMVLTQSILKNTMENHAIKEIDPEVGATFDPHFHEAISMQETKEMDPNRIVQVVQKGYVLQSRLLRPARVIVSKAP